jgi:hypothetical protein
VGTATVQPQMEVNRKSQTVDSVRLVSPNRKCGPGTLSTWPKVTISNVDNRSRLLPDAKRRPWSQTYLAAMRGVF